MLIDLFRRVEAAEDIYNVDEFGVVRRSRRVDIGLQRGGRRVRGLLSRSRVQWSRQQQTIAGDTHAQTGAATGRRVPVRVRGRQRSPPGRIDPAGREPDRSVLVHGPERQGDHYQVYGGQGRFPHNTGRSRAKSARFSCATPTTAGLRSAAVARSQRSAVQEQVRRHTIDILTIIPCAQIRPIYKSSCIDNKLLLI